MMNQRNRVIDQICHHETIPVPYVLGVEEPVGRELDAYYGSPEWRGRIRNAISWLPAPHEDLGIGAWEEGAPHTDLFGTTWITNGTLTHLEAPPLLEPTFQGYHFPDVADCFTPDWEARAWKAIESNDERTFLVCGIGFGVFERAWTLRGFDNALADAATEPAFYAALVEAITDHQIAILDRILPLPIDGIMFSDDWGYQKGILLGPKRWRQFIKPCYERLYDRVHAAGKFTLNHCCGSIVDILPDLIEIGLDVYESVQPEAAGNDPFQLKRRFGDSITFFGGFGAQSMPHYTPEGARETLRTLRREMSRGGGYILAPAKPIPTGTPVEVAAAVVETFTEMN